MTNRDHDDLLSTATDRFERRLAEESAKQRAETAQLRVDMMKGDAEIRADVANLRLEMTQQFGAMRTDMTAQFGAMRTDMAEQLGAMRTDMAEQRIASETRHRDLLKWALMLWLGQATAIAGVIGAVGYFFARR